MTVVSKLRQPVSLTLGLAAAAGPPPRPATAVMVVGMHRSGTSALTRVVNLLGPALGRDDDLVASRPSNLKGQWESLSMTGFQEALLHKLGGSWDDPPELPIGWERRRALLLELGRARRLVRHVYRDAPLWVWKDPRTSLTLPFWRRVLPRHTFVPIAIHRHPLDVAKSLASRDGLSEERGLTLWEIYNRTLLRNLDGMQALHVSYEQLTLDPAAACARIRDFLVTRGVAAAPVPEEAVRAVDPSLRHHSAGEEVRERVGITPAQRELYETLVSLEETARHPLPTTRIDPR